MCGCGGASTPSRVQTDRGDVGDEVPVADAPSTQESKCDLDVAIALFDSVLRPRLEGCRACHDMSAAAGLLKKPGPTWFHPSDSQATLDFLFANELISGSNPTLSLFLLKPLALSCGGVDHEGGPLITCNSPAHSDFMAFLEHAAPCVVMGTSDAGTVRGSDPDPQRDVGR
jgi:hypothetical protein